MGLKSDIEMQPFRWDPGEGFTVLPGFSPDVYMEGNAMDLNLAGTVVGHSYDAQSDAQQAAVWPTTGGILKLNPDEPHSGVAMAINDVNLVAGWTYTAAGARATIWRIPRGAAPAPPAAAPRVSLRRRPPSSREGAAACLTDRSATRSRQGLLHCMAQARP